ncbi:acetyl-CoA synthetase-like protein [Hyaloscypha variabilis F]|uniref:Acetyl-CoA synthetase-like protein n=1 Tax=Hyaloscypha variabilis (strain UAMH 11265 / GT02V1 / F) TaxID=1149755 RepID=A0A2J6RLE2_HYAVF|nr:acetyl-CoA synthetase-like protein [Hyaloscypha variabilis F]
MGYKEYASQEPDLELVRSCALSYIFSNPRNTAPDKVVFFDPITGLGRTYSEIQKRTRSLAQGLKSLGVKPNDVIAFMSPNSIDYAITCYAVLGCGAVVSPVNAASTSTELEGQLKTSTARFLIAHSSLVALAENAVLRTKVEKLIQADGQSDKHGDDTAETLAGSLVAGELDSIQESELDTRLAFLCFSSGTTGKAKGVRTSHKNVTSNMQQWSTHLPEDFTGSGVSIGFLPFSHIYGLMYYCCLAMFSGSTVIVVNKFDFGSYLGYIQKYRPESLIIVPPVALRLAKDTDIPKYDLSSVKRIMSAAAPLSPELRRATEMRLKQLFDTDVFIYQAWGATETSPMITAVPQNRPDKKDTVGNVVRNVVCRIVDPETLADVEVSGDGVSKPGEIWCRGPNVTAGYYANEASTREAFVVDEQGNRWYRSGDIGTVDDEGFFTIVDRIKEMIKYKGLQVVPSELEGKLLEHSAVADACVVGVWVEEQATELPVAFVVISAEAKDVHRHKLTKRIHQHINAKVAHHKRLRGGIIFVDAIPKSPSGKILRRELKETVKSQKLGSKL